MHLPHTLGGKFLVTLLLLDGFLIGVGVANLVTLSGLRDRVDAVNSRGLVPLTHLRAAQNGDHGAVISGFAAAQTNDQAGADALLANAADFQDTADAELQKTLETTPESLLPQAEELAASYQAFLDADEAYRAGATGPEAADLAEKGTALYTETETQFDALADAFVEDAAEQRAAVTSDYHRAVMLTFLIVTVALMLSLGVGWMLIRSLNRRTAVVLSALDAVAQGDLTRTAQLPGQDEIAHMAEAINRGLASTRTALTKVSGSATQLATSAAGLSSNADQTAQSASQAVHAVDVVAGNADSVARTVDDVATSTIELGTSIRDISTSAQEAAKVAGNAVGVVETTNETISQLGNSSEEIGNVIQVIQSIAAQTSLLALNATIEAARAGEAGRGFAVVAGEVKDLARETAEATDSVINRVQAIQQDTEGAVRAIGEIGEIIEQINTFQGSIAAAVEEQSVTADSINASIQEAQAVTRQIASTIDQVASASQSSEDAVTSTRNLAGEISGMGDQLGKIVQEFRL
jgi:methyl-accepting chemotaxis protein